MMFYYLFTYLFPVPDALRVDDWDAANVEVSRLQKQGKVIFYQKYSPMHEDLKQRPFVVIQDDFMRTNAKRFSRGNSWAFDSTIKTNQYDLPLYAAVVPNQDGKAMPVFYMLCTKDKGGGHEGIAIELAFTYVFLNIGDVRPSAVIIDKHLISLNAIRCVVNNDIHCWKNGRVGEDQVAGRVFLCWFHVMKAWSENLLTRVPILDKDKVWQSLHVLLNCPREDHFEENVRKLYTDFEHILGLEEYMRCGWVGDTVPWRSLWPKFGRLFEYGGMDTTDHVERHWEWIKYTLLQGNVNRSIRDLIVAIIGSAADGSRT